MSKERLPTIKPEAWSTRICHLARIPSWILAVAYHVVNTAVLAGADLTMLLCLIHFGPLSVRIVSKSNCRPSSCVHLQKRIASACSLPFP